MMSSGDTVTPNYCKQGSKGTVQMYVKRTTLWRNRLTYCNPRLIHCTSVPLLQLIFFLSLVRSCCKTQKGFIISPGCKQKYYALNCRTRVENDRGYENPPGYSPGVSEGRGKGMYFATPSVPLPLWGVPGVSGIPEG
jgi:hypothetical protein